MKKAQPPTAATEDRDAAMWKPVRAAIRRSRSVLITSHVFPDGDAVGSQLALAKTLRAMGKRVLLVSEHPVPKIYEFLDRRRSIKLYDHHLEPKVRKCDTAFVVDVGSLDRVGRVAHVIRKAKMTTVCIDHHRTNARFADVNLLDPACASTGELIYALAKALRTPVTPQTAACLFVALATDTGWFRFTNTKPDTLRTAAELVELGARPAALYSAVHESLGWPRMALMKCVLETLRSQCDGRIAYLYATDQMMRQTGAQHEDTEGFTNIPRVLGGVKLIFFFREADGKIKVSIRSKGGPPVDKLAKKHGGGGHAQAAGITMAGPLRSVMKTVLADARRLIAGTAK